jgi:hypothetical protein
MKNYRGKQKLRAPVVFFTYKRSINNSGILSRLIQAKPSRLYVISDAPKNKEDALLCESVNREIESIDIDCEVLRCAAEDNMGCTKRIVSGLNYVYEREEEAIIIEDDCIPEVDFLYYADELLQRYRDRQDVMMISGQSFYKGRKREESYFFSREVLIWGWATWRRAWNKYADDLSDWSSVERSELFEEYFTSEKHRNHWKQLFSLMNEEKIESWDLSWKYICMKENGLCIVPYVNMVKNIGNDDKATRTTRKMKLFNMPSSRLIGEMKHPQEVMWNKKEDVKMVKRIFKLTWGGISRRLSRRYIRKAKSIISKMNNNYRLKIT